MRNRRTLARLERLRFERLSRQATASLGLDDPRLRRYAHRYHKAMERRATRSRASREEACVQAVLSSEVTLCGDYHTLPEAQKAALRLWRRVVPLALAAGRPVVLALEMLRPEDDARTAAFVRGELEEATLQERIGYGRHWGFSWDSYRELLRFARAFRLPVVGINRTGGGLEARDRGMARQIEQARAKHPGALVLVLVGDWHLAPAHLPKALASAGRATKVRVPTVALVHQNAEPVFWKHTERARGVTPHCVRLGPREFCLLTVPPSAKVRSHLRWVAAESESDLRWRAAQQNREAAGDFGGEGATLDEEDVWEFQELVLAFLGARLPPDGGLSVLAASDRERWEPAALRSGISPARCRRWIDALQGLAFDHDKTVVVGSLLHGDLALWAAWALVARLSDHALHPATSDRTALVWRWALAFLGARLALPFHDDRRSPPAVDADDRDLVRCVEARQEGEALGRAFYRGLMEERIERRDVVELFVTPLIGARAKVELARWRKRVVAPPRSLSDVA